jgi:RNA polymerase primary sigma factor
MASERLRQEFKREPSLGEISDATQIKKTKVVQLLSAGPRPISLETPTGEDGEAELIENIPSNGNGNPQEQTERGMLSVYTQELLSQLNSREEKIIRMRYGLDGKNLTLQEVADKLGITRERVRQIQEKAVSKMRNKAYLNGLSDFLN